MIKLSRLVRKEKVSEYKKANGLLLLAFFMVRGCN